MAQEIFFTNNTKSKDLILEHWWVSEGEMVHNGQQIASVRDGDRIYIVRAPYEGILYQKYLHNNETFSRQAPLAKIISKEEAGNIKISGKLSTTERKIIDSIHVTESGNASSKRIHIKASPSARRKARVNKIDLEQVTGTGPNGRIQLRDVNEYIRQNLEVKEKPKSFKNKTIRYGLPLTGLARKLAQKFEIDPSKIPAPPGANRIKREDVERYINDPEGAVAKLEALYNIYETSDLENPVVQYANMLPQVHPGEPESQKQEEPTIIRLGTEKPSIIKSGPTIELDTEKILSLETTVTKLLNSPEKEAASVIRLPSLETSAIPSNAIIELTTTGIEEPLYLLPFEYKSLTEPPENESASVIKLTTEEEEVIPSSGVIILTGEEIKLLAEQTSETIEEKQKRILADRKERGINLPVILLPETMPEVKTENSESIEKTESQKIKTPSGQTEGISIDHNGMVLLKDLIEASETENKAEKVDTESGLNITPEVGEISDNFKSLETEIDQLKGMILSLKDTTRAQFAGLKINNIEKEISALKKELANLEGEDKISSEELVTDQTGQEFLTVSNILTLSNKLEELEKAISAQQKETDLIKDMVRARFTGLDLNSLKEQLNRLEKRTTLIEETGAPSLEAHKLELSGLNKSHLVTLANINLIELVKKYNPPTNEIGQFLKNYILATIYEVYSEIKPECEIYYIADINSSALSSYHSDDIDTVKTSILNKIEKTKVKFKPDDLTVVELLPYNLAGVSGLEQEENNVLYISYIKNLNQFFTEKINIRSILELSLDFNLDNLSVQEGIVFIENLRKKLESLEVPV